MAKKIQKEPEANVVEATESKQYTLTVLDGENIIGTAVYDEEPTKDQISKVLADLEKAFNRKNFTFKLV